jgi:hypothetical protein
MVRSGYGKPEYRKICVSMQDERIFLLKEDKNKNY